MKKASILYKVFAASLAVALVGGAFIATPVGSMVGVNTSVSAVTYTSPVVTVGDYQYALYSDGTANVVGYIGTKDLSTTSVGMPTVVYAKDVSTSWTYLQYNSSYKVTKMQAGIFSGCKFRTLSLPRYLESITGGFYGAEIGGFFIDESNSYFSSIGFSGAYGLYNKSGTTLYAYPSNPGLYVSGFGTATKGFPSTLTRIEDQAFANSKLYTVTIPSKVTYVGDRVFLNSRVTSVTFDGDAPTFRFMPSETIPDHGTFEGASSLYQINIKGKDGNYNTDSYGNVYNKDMTKLVLVPQGRTSAFNVASTCTEIGDYAFYHSNANGPVIYDQVKTIGSSAFYGVKSNFKVYCLKDTPTETYVKNKSIPYTYAYEYTTASDGVTITKYNGPYSSPAVPTKINGKDVVAIGKEAFRNNDTLTAVYLYSPIAAIGDYAFYDCDKLTKVSMPYTVKSIGERAFYSCELMSFTALPSNLETIGTYAFGYCKALTDVTIPSKVTQINYGAFYACSGLKNLTIGAGLKNIGAFAFENAGLTSQYIPKNVTFIGDYAFGYNFADGGHTRNTSFEFISGYPDTEAETYAKENDIEFKSVITYSLNSGKIEIENYSGSDTRLVIPDTINGYPVTSIKGYAFNGSNVTSVTLPSSMTELNGYAFYGASKLTSVTIPSSVTSIGSYAFEFCSSLKSITIPASVKQIGNGAFYDCTALTSVKFNEGLQKIGAYAFENTGLTAVTLPSTVTNIGAYAFADNWKDSTHTPVDGFKMTGYVDTAAETYANENNHIVFSPLYLKLVNNSRILNTLIADEYSVSVGDSINIKGDASGGKKPYKYAAYLQTPGGTNILSTGYTSETALTLKPTASGNYNVVIYVMDDRNVGVSKTFSVVVKAPALINESTVSAETANVGDNITINGKASGGEGEYYYAAGVSYNGGDFVSIRSYSSDPAITFSADKSGTYTIRSYVKDSNETITPKDFTVVVSDKPVEALVNTSVIAKTTVTLGEKVYITCSAEGGKAPYVYGVFYKKASTEKWTTIQSFKDNTAVVFKPGAAVAYDVCVKVKDSTGKIEKKYFTVKVTKPLENKSTIDAETIKKGESVTVTCSATGGSTPYLYGVYYKKATSEKWSTVQTYKKNAVVKITPLSAVKYDICVKVKDSTGKIEKKYFVLTVTK